jgi:hypothetical protein
MPRYTVRLKPPSEPSEVSVDADDVDYVAAQASSDGTDPYDVGVLGYNFLKNGREDGVSTTVAWFPAEAVAYITSR